MSSFSRLFAFLMFATFCTTSSHVVFATTRAPASQSEKSLLYWRYLCRNHPQTDSVRNGMREFSCPSEGFKVRASSDENRVKEVIEDGDR